MLAAIDSTITFGFSTYDPDTGQNQTPAALPTVAIRDSTGTPDAYTPTPSAVGTGMYTVEVDVASLSGVVPGKKYTVWATAEMAPSGGGDNVTATAVIGQFETSGVSHGADMVTDVDGKTPKEFSQIVAAVVTGKIADAGTGTETFKGLDGVTDRVQNTVDQDGNRTAVVFDP